MVRTVAHIMGGIGEVKITRSPEFKNLTTIGTGGRADALILPVSRRSLAEVVKRLSREEVDYFVFGRGSNILVPDRGVDMVALGICEYLNNVRLNGMGVVAEGGTSLPRLAVLAALSGLSGLEELAGIPGTVGGALVMNAGAYGREMGELVQWIEVVDENGDMNRIPSSMIDFRYRKAVLPAGSVVCRAYLELKESSKGRVFSKMRKLNRMRKEVQPWGEKTFGSVFKNPPGESAGKLVEEAGLKGFGVGGAGISKKHANFIINRGGASTDDVLFLIEKMKKAVYARRGINLEPEVKCIG